MTQNSERLPLQESLNRLAINRALEAMGTQGASLPCRVVAVQGSIVTVAFEVQSGFAIPNITIPKLESAWIRSPTQVGDLGMTVPCDVYLGGISGLGGGTATLQRRNNLATLAWLPVASTGFSAVNTSQAFVSGPSGAVVQTQDGTVSMVVSESGVAITVGGKTWSFTAAGFTASDSIVFETHVHGGVQSGSSTTTGPL